MGLFIKHRQLENNNDTQLNSVRIIDSSANNYTNRHVTAQSVPAAASPLELHTAIAHIDDIGDIYCSTSKQSQHGYIVKYDDINNNDDAYTQQAKLKCQKMYIVNASVAHDPSNNLLFIRPSTIKSTKKSNFSEIIDTLVQTTGDEEQKELVVETELDDYYGGAIQQPLPVVYNNVLTTAQALQTLTKQNIDTDGTVDEESDNESGNNSNGESSGDESEVDEPLKCGVCQSIDIIDPWISPCHHICCSECWVTYLSNANNHCPVCKVDIDVEQLKSVVLCSICGDECIDGYTPKCSHTACNSCWIEELAVEQTCPVCHSEVLLSEMK